MGVGRDGRRGMVLPVSIAKDIFRATCEFYCYGQIRLIEVFEELFDIPSVLGDELPLDPPLGSVSERIEPRAAQKLQFCQDTERMPDPRSVFPLDQMPVSIAFP